MALDLAATTAVMDYVTEAAPVLALTLDARQRVTAANAHARRALGESVVGRSLSELLVDFTPAPALNSEASERAVERLLSFATAEGPPESYHFRFVPLAEGWLALGHLDFEEQIRLRTQVLELNRELNDLARQLHLANAELRDLNGLKNQFLGMAAHDLRKPVGAVMTYAEFVLDEAGEALSAEHRRFLQTCLNAASGMKGIIDDFLDVAIIESGKFALDLAPVTAGEILRGAEEIGQLTAVRKKVKLSVEPSPDSRAVQADAPKVQQALINFIGNAVEHSRPGGRVWASAAWQEGELVFSVRDEGPGIRPEDRAMLFQPFARCGTKKTAGERSVGLGLAIARRVAEAHGGRAWVESAPGRGATFFLALPIAEESRTVRIG